MLRILLATLFAAVALALPDPAAADAVTPHRATTCQTQAQWRASTRNAWRAKSARTFRAYHRRHRGVSLHRYRTHVRTLAKYRRAHPWRRCTTPPSGPAPTPPPGGGPSTPPPTSWVDPLIGTGPGNTHVGFGFDDGNVTPAAMVPFGMTQMGPYTHQDPIRPGGYDNRSTTMAGFPLTALSGAGCPYYGDAPFMPFVGAVDTSPETDPAHYRSSFQKSSESVRAGYYSVLLDQPQTRVELTATTRANLARFTFPASADATLLVRSSAEQGGARAASFDVVGDDTVEGTVSAGSAFCGRSTTPYTLHFTARFSVPFTGFGTWSGTSLAPSQRSADGGRSGAYLRFDTRSDRVVVAKIALSWVSRSGARQNLAAEAPDFDFDKMRAAAGTTWDRELGRIAVTGGTEQEKRVFYTALYHAMVAPNTASDVDGGYTGFDSQVHQTGGWTQYANYSGWDAYRSWFSLLAVIEPRVASDLAQSLVVDGQQGGALPSWSTVSGETAVMPGDAGPPGIASAFAFGARSFDTAAALQLMLDNALVPGTTSQGHELRVGLADYLARGYRPGGSPSTDLEYASSDFAISRFARALGDDAHAGQLEAHSQSWQNLFNPATGYVQPRTAGGSFTTPFDPSSGKSYVEGNAAQYTWMVPHNIGGLVAAIGGERAAADRLDAYFTQVNAGLNQPYAYLGNEPSAGDPWIYNWVGQPWKAQSVARRALLEIYGDGPGGLPGNEDLGATSAWAVWAALGLYPAIPGVGGLAVGSPLFPTATITLGNGARVTITAPGASAQTPYVRSLTLDGRPIQRSWLTWEELGTGAALGFDVATTPSSWASDYRPPSYRTGQAAGIGYLDSDEVHLRPGESITIDVGVQNLRAEPLDATWAPVLPAGLSAHWESVGGLRVASSGRATTALTLTAAGDAPDTDQVVDLGLRAADGSTLGPSLLHVTVGATG